MLDFTHVIFDSYLIASIIVRNKVNLKESLLTNSNSLRIITWKVFYYGNVD